MAVAATATKNLTVDQLIATAMRSVGVLNNAQEPEPEDLVHGRTILWLHLQALQSRGVLVRARERVELSLTVGQNYVDAPSDTLSIEDNAVVRNSDGVTDVPVTMYDLAQYQALPRKDVLGQPRYFYPEQVSATTTWRIYLYPVPEDTSWPTLIVPRTRRLRDVEEGSVNLDLAPAWLLPIMRAIGEEFARNKGRKDTASEMSQKYEFEAERAENDENAGRGGGMFVASPSPWDW